MSGAIGSPGDNVGLIGRSIFTTYLLAFEVTSALLVVAVVGAVVLARRPRRALGENGAPTSEPGDASQATASQATASQATASQATASQATASQATASQAVAGQATASPTWR